MLRYTRSARSASRPRPFLSLSRTVVVLAVIAGSAVVSVAGVASGAMTAFTAQDAFGRVTTLSTDPGGINLRNPFFQSLGTNGRSCSSCQKLEDAMGISVSRIRIIFRSSRGLDPLFRTNDGSNAPSGIYANTSTLRARLNSFSMLLNHGVIRVGLPMPANADFSLVRVHDPYGFASVQELSNFRRPLPSTNAGFFSTVMWDGRETPAGRTIHDSLMNQANDATRGHAQGTQDLSDAIRNAIATFQEHLFSAQSFSRAVGRLDVAGCTTDEDGDPCEAAQGSVQHLSTVTFTLGINDVFDPSFDHVSFLPFDPWEDIPESDTSRLADERRDIGLGENTFYTKTFSITGVKGLNDVLGRAVIVGTCTTCHNTPDVGNHSQARFFDIGVASPFLTLNPLAGNLADFPRYTFQRNDDGTQLTTTDAGRALITGNFDDIGKFKPPVLRGLPARAPYFHNGAARTLEDVVNFYNGRFNIGFSDEEKRQLIKFLRSI